MLFIIGVGITVIGCVMTGVFLKQVIQEKAEAQVEELFLKPLPNDSHKREHRHAKISYHLKGSKCIGEILLKSQPKVGDKIKLSLHPTDPGKLTHYAPTKEAFTIAMVFVMGIGMMGLSYYAKQTITFNQTTKQARLAHGNAL